MPQRKSFKETCIEQIEGNLTAPEHGYFKTNELFVRLCCMQGGKLKYFNLSRLAVAKYLYRRGRIYTYAVDACGNVNMYNITLQAQPGHRGAVEWKETLALFAWEDLILTRHEVTELAAMYEFKRIAVIIGLIATNAKAKLRARVVEMFPKNRPQAA